MGKRPEYFFNDFFLLRTFEVFSDDWLKLGIGDVMDGENHERHGDDSKTD